jgi:hypothetical protein
MGAFGRSRETGVSHFVFLATVLALLGLPAACFVADDLIQLCTLEGFFPAGGSAPWRLYTLSDGVPAHVLALENAGALPWFFDPSFRMDFLRPTSSALLSLDYRLFGLHPLGYAVHDAVWFVLLVLSAALVFRYALPKGAQLSSLIFAISGIHGILAWTATRHIAIAGALGLFGLLAHLRGRLEARPALRVLALVLLALSLSASEAGVALAAYVFAFELFGAEDSRRSRLSAALPVALLLGLYLAVRALAGAAVAGSGYIDPSSEPLRFLAELPGRLLVLGGGVLAGGSADLWVLLPHERRLLMFGGAALIAAFSLPFSLAWTSAPPAERRPVAWLAAAALLSAVPFAGTPIGSRCLVIPFFGGAALVAFVLRRWWTVLRREAGALRRVAGVLCLLFALVHLGMAPIERLGLPFLLRAGMHDHLARAMDEADISPTELSTAQVVLLDAPDMAVGFHSWFFRKLHGMPMPAQWRVLSWAPCEHHYQRTGEATLELDLRDCSIESPNVPTGEVIALEGLVATVLSTGEQGPDRVAFRFDRPLDDPSVRLLAWDGTKLIRVDAPELGTTLRLSGRHGIGTEP